MDANKPEDKKPEESVPNQGVSEDALEKPSADVNGNSPLASSDGDGKTPPAKKTSPVKALLKRFNLYLLIFIFVVVIAGIVGTVAYLNSKKAAKTPDVANTTLTPDQLKQLANSDSTVGDTGQTLTIQGNAVVDGTMLVRSNLNVAGTITLGNQLTVPNLTVAGTANLADTQVKSLQVANAMTIQGLMTLQSGLNVAGNANFGGSVTAGTVTVTNLIMSGNAQLQIPNHIAFTGPSPGRTVNSAALGNGGSASVNGSDTSGTLNVNTGSSPQAGCFATITFNKKYESTPRVIATAVGSAAGQTELYVTRTATSFQICTANSAPAFSELAYDYFVMD